MTHQQGALDSKIRVFSQRTPKIKGMFNSAAVFNEGFEVRHQKPKETPDATPKDFTKNSTRARERETEQLLVSNFRENLHLPETRPGILKSSHKPELIELFGVAGPSPDDLLLKQEDMSTSGRNTFSFSPKILSEVPLSKNAKSLPL